MVLLHRMNRSNQKVHELNIKFDPCNAAQFYACCGLIELAEIAGNCTSSQFAVSNTRPRQADFILKTEAELDLQAAVANLRQAEYSPFNGDGSEYLPAK